MSDWDGGWEARRYADRDDGGAALARARLMHKWRQIRDPILDEPLGFQPVTYARGEGQSLRDRFREAGLQVIIKMATIELTPDKPDFPAGGWHVRSLPRFPFPVSRFPFPVSRFPFPLFPAVPLFHVFPASSSN